MANDIVSRATRRAFQESYVAHAVLREIAEDFDDADVERGELSAGSLVSGERRRLIEGYYVNGGLGLSVERAARLRRVRGAPGPTGGEVPAGRSVEPDQAPLL